MKSTHKTGAQTSKLSIVDRNKSESKTSSIPAQLATPNDLGNKAAHAIATAINPLVADAFALFVKTKNFHWHMSGRHYRDYHLLLDEQSTQIFAMIDTLAERVRKMGGATIRSVGHIHDLTSVKDDNDAFVEPKKMIQRLMQDNKDYAARMRAAHAVCDEHNDIATTSLLENFIDETEERTWFLFETQLD